MIGLRFRFMEIHADIHTQTHVHIYKHSHILTLYGGKGTDICEQEAVHFSLHCYSSVFPLGSQNLQLCLCVCVCVCKFVMIFL
jgi:hypothetical protein